MKEYKDSDAFEADTTTATTGAYNLGFNDYKNKVTNAFMSLNLYRVILMGELEEDEEEDEEEEPV